MRVFLDSNAIIYLVEGSDALQQTLVRQIEAKVGEASIQMASALSRLECRAKPMAAGNTELLARYETFFLPDSTVVVSIDDAVIERATYLRGSTGLRTPDAILAASAIEHAADFFVTADRDFQKCPELNVLLLQKLTV